MRFFVSVITGIYFLLVPVLSSAQLNQEELKLIWNDNSRTYEVRLEAADNLIWDYYMYSRPDSAVFFAKEMLKLASEKKQEKYQSTAYNSLGVAYWNMGEFSLAIENYTQCMELDKKLGDLNGVSISMNNIALILADQGLFSRASDYYAQSLKIKESINDIKGIAKTLNNMGILLTDQGDYEKAMEYHLKSLVIKRDQKNQAGVAASLNNIGMVYAKKRDSKNAMKFYKESLTLKQKLGDKKGSALTLSNMGQIYFEKNNLTKAESLFSESLRLSQETGDRPASADALIGLGQIYLKEGQTEKALNVNNEALKIAEEIGLVDLIQKAAGNLFKNYRNEGEFEKALEMHELHITMKDSLLNEESRKAVLKQQFKYEYERKLFADSLAFENERAIKDLIIAEKDARSQKQMIALLSVGITLFFLLVLAITIYRGKKRSEALLLNILPEQTAQELKETGTSEAKIFENVSIIFTDFVDFTKLSEQLTPQELVEELNDCFCEFDRIIKKRGLEKIKTIGDAYMAVAGLPVPSADHAERTVLAALDILSYMNNRSEKHTLSKIKTRVGIHSGRVVAGIVGLNKFQYDIWGDTVNTAARMETFGVADKINISHTTFELIKKNPLFSFTRRGNIEIKGKGEMDLYLVDNA